jgi:hypothetical protein
VSERFAATCRRIVTAVAIRPPPLSSAPPADRYDVAVLVPERVRKSILSGNAGPSGPLPADERASEFRGCADPRSATLIAARVAIDALSQ